MGDISSHLEGIIGHEGGKIGHNMSLIASGVTDDQNFNYILSSSRSAYYLANILQ